MNLSRTLILSAVFTLVGGGTVLGAQASSKNTSTESPNSAKATVHEETGTISSLTNSELVLSHTVKGKQEEITFKLDSSTRKVGIIDKGAHVAVSYKDQNHERVATEVKAELKKS